MLRFGEISRLSYAERIALVRLGSDLSGPDCKIGFGGSALEVLHDDHLEVEGLNLWPVAVAWRCYQTSSTVI